MITFLIVLGALVALGVFCVKIYNALVMGRNESDNAFAQIEIQLTRRYELIPNLVKVAKEYMNFEKETLIGVIDARNQAKGALDAAKSNPNVENLASLSAAETALTGKMNGLFALFENYPELKANAQMMQLSEEISSTENKVAFARQHFNDVVTHFNNSMEIFPNNLVANNFGFRKKGLLELQDMEEKSKPLVINFDN